MAAGKKKTISANLPGGLVGSIEDIVKELDLDDFTQGLRYVAKIGVIVHNHRKDLKDPEIAKYLEEQFALEGLADWVDSLDERQWRQLWGLMTHQRDIRIARAGASAYDLPARRVDR